MFRFNQLEQLGFTYSAVGNIDKTYRCRLCKFKHTDKYIMGEHYDIKHKDSIPPNTDGYRYFYYLQTGKDKGSCIICQKETQFNRSSMKYSRFCDNPECKAKYREQFKQRMIGKFGKIHLLNDPEIQKRMLANRKISGTYTWSDGSVSLGYVGSYELDFLKMLDIRLKWKSSDIMAPSPHVYTYKYKDINRFYIPDFYIPSHNIEIEIKGTGMESRNIDSHEKDKVKVEMMKTNSQYFNFLQIVDKNYDEFFELIKEE